MVLEYIVPRVGIDESDVGPRPTPSVSLATIGIVGTFEKGPVNTPLIIGDQDQQTLKFGKIRYDLTGPISFMGAVNQGANDFVIVRIGGESLATAAVTFKDESGKDSLIYEASSPGTWANGDKPSGIKVAVAPGTLPDTVKLIVISHLKSRVYDNIALDSMNMKDEDGTFKKAENATALPKIVAATPLTGGDNGAETKPTDYIGEIKEDGTRTGLKVLETDNCSIVLAAQQTDPAIRAALLTHCETAELEDGLRRAILNSPIGTSPAEALKLTESLDSARGNLVYPWVEPLEKSGVYVAPDGYFAGLLSVLAAQKSPSNKQLNGILSTEYKLSSAELKALTLAKINPITLVKNRGFRVRNGVTLCSDPAWDQVNIRRIFDKIEMQIYDSTQWAVSEDALPDLWGKIATQIDMMLQIMKGNKEIFDYKSTICNEKINTPEVVQARRLITIVRVRPIYAADYIDHRISRLIGNEA